eukprot:4489156-Pleurochrysis_carterae.AAC.2
MSQCSLRRMQIREHAGWLHSCQLRPSPPLPRLGPHPRRALVPRAPFATGAPWRQARGSAQGHVAPTGARTDRGLPARCKPHTGALTL